MHRKDALPEDLELDNGLHLDSEEAYSGELLRRVLIAVMTGKSVPIRDRIADFPEGLAKVIERVLCFDAASRYPDVWEFRAALAPFC